MIVTKNYENSVVPILPNGFCTIGEVLVIYYTMITTHLLPYSIFYTILK